MSRDPLNRFLIEVEKKAYRMAYMATGKNEDALDIVQDAMMGFARSYAAKPPGDWKPLFYRVLENKITDHYRRESVRNRWRQFLDKFSGKDEDELEVTVDSFADPVSPEGSESLKMQQAVSALEKALTELPRRQQQAFMLRCWEGLSTRDTATAMGCSEGSIKTHYSRALHSLQAKLEHHRL